MPTNLGLGILVRVEPPATVVSPLANVFSYAYCTQQREWLGTLRGITAEPVFTGVINQGTSALTLTIDHYPIELTMTNLIRVTYPSGQVAGYWEYEGKKSVMESGKSSYTLTLTPLSAEMAGIAVNSNYSTDTTQPTTALGPVTFSVPVLAAAAQTLNITPGIVTDDGVDYSYVYNNATGNDTLSQALLFGGTSWWWYVDPMGVLSLNNVSPFTHEYTVGKDVEAGEWDDDILSMCNGQPVMGGTGSDGVTSLTAFAVDTNPDNPFSVPNVGQRTAAQFQDTSLVDQASVNTVAANLLDYVERVTSTRILTITHLSPGDSRPQPGDAVLLREASATDPTKIGTVSVDGPYLITQVVEYGGTGRFQVQISASMVVPVSSYNPNLATEQAILKLMQNPVNLAVSPSGTVGNVGTGVVGGAAASGALNASPSAPDGLAATSGIDNLAQVNNAYISLSWSPNEAADGVSAYTAKWRRAADPDVAASYYQQQVNVTGFKIGGLYQSIGYALYVQATNSAGVTSAWSAELLVTTDADTTAPATPTGLVAYRTPRGASVTWNGNTEADLQGYVLQEATDGSGVGWQTVMGPEPGQSATPQLAGASLNTSFNFIAPSGTAQQTILYFRVAALDWSGNLSPFTGQTPAIYTDGVSFAELTAGDINVTGTLNGGTIQTSASGPRVWMNNSGIYLSNGSSVDLGMGPGITMEANSQTGDLTMSGTLVASQIQGVAGGADGSGPRMWADFADTTPGVGPEIVVSDGTYQRVQIGNLAESDGSPAQDGVRVFDPMGNILFDTVLGFTANNHWGTFYYGNVSCTSVELSAFGPTVTVSVAYRPQSVYVNIKGSFATTGSAAELTVGYGTSLGQYENVSGSISSTGGTPFGFFGSFYQLPVGSYTFSMLGIVASGGDLTVSDPSIDIFILGGSNAGD